MTVGQTVWVRRNGHFDPAVVVEIKGVSIDVRLGKTNRIVSVLASNVFEREVINDD